MEYLAISGGVMETALCLVTFLAFLACNPGLCPADPAPTTLDVSVALDGATHRDSPRRKADISYSRVSQAASLEERMACWEAMRISRMDPDGWVQVGGSWIRQKSEAHYYDNADAKEAMDLNLQSQQYHAKGMLWAGLSTGIAVVGCGIAGGFVGAAQPSADAGDFVDLDQEIHAVEGALVGIGVGVVVGLSTGLWIQSSDNAQSRKLEVQAAESFNRKLLKDLRLDVEPLRGGGELKVKTQF